MIHAEDFTDCNTAALNPFSSSEQVGKRLNMMIHRGGMLEPSDLIYRWTGVGAKGGGEGVHTGCFFFHCALVLPSLYPDPECSSHNSDKIQLFFPSYSQP